MLGFVLEHNVAMIIPLTDYQTVIAEQQYWSMNGLVSFMPFHSWIAEMLVCVRIHRRNPTAVRYRCAQHCDSENEHSIVTAVVAHVTTVCWDNDVYISVTVMATDSAVTALSVATNFTVMCTSLPRCCEHRFTVLSVPPLSQCCQLSPLSH